jgi:IMP dehydrogenase
MAEIFIGKGKATRRAYGFDEIALVPGSVTCDLELCDVSFTLGNIKLDIPIFASAMDSVVDVKSAIAMSKAGGIAVLNLQGLQTRYEDVDSAYAKIASCDDASFIELMQKLYDSPIKHELISKRIAEIKKAGAIACASVTPNMARELAPIAKAAGLDIIVVQSTVTGIEHKSARADAQLDLKVFCREIGLPVIVGNCVTYDTALKLMETGVAGILVGVGPGAACTSRSVLGIGVPMATAIADCRKAADDYLAKTAKTCAIIADGGMVVGGDICKAIALGADAVMIGSPLAKAKEAPGRGFHWGMATPSPVLPRGTRIKVGTAGLLSEILFGPAHIDDGSHNLIGALKTSMSTLGAVSLKEMQAVDVVIAPSILTEGKVFQKAQHLGMGR